MFLVFLTHSWDIFLMTKDISRENLGGGINSEYLFVQEMFSSSGKQKLKPLIVSEVMLYVEIDSIFRSVSFPSAAAALRITAVWVHPPSLGLSSWFPVMIRSNQITYASENTLCFTFDGFNVCLPKTSIFSATFEPHKLFFLTWRSCRSKK